MSSCRKLGGVAQRSINRIETSFDLLGQAVAGRPWRTLSVVGVVVLACCAGFANFEIETDSAKLWAPQNSESVGFQRQMNSLFGYRDVTVFFYAVPTQGGTCLTKDRILDLYDAYEIVSSLEVREDGSQYSLTELCRKAGHFEPYNSTCTMRSVLDWWDYNRTLIENDNDVLATLRESVEDATGNNIAYSAVLGGIEYDDNGTLLSAQAFSFTTWLLNNASLTESEEKNPKQTCSWEVEFGTQMMDRSVGELRTYPSARCYLSTLIRASLDDDLYLMALDYVLMLCFATYVMSTDSWLTSKASMAIVAVGFVLLAMLSAFGLGSAIGLQYSAMVQLLGFLLLGLGIDDAFVIVQNYRQVEDRSSPAAILGATMRSAGSSITVTSISDTVAFLSCLGNSLPVIRAVCGFGALGVVVDFAYQVTGFVAMLAFAHKRENAGRADCACCYVVRETDMTCRGKLIDQHKPTRLQQFLKNTYSSVILSKGGKVVVLCLSISIFSVSCWVAPKIQADYNMKWFIPYNSPGQQTLRVGEEYFGGTQRTFAVVTGSVDYSSSVVQLSMQNLFQDLESQSGISRCRSWSNDFETYYSNFHANETTALGLAPENRYFVWLDEFLQTEGRGWYMAIKNTSALSSTSIVAARYSCTTIRKELTGGELVDIMDSVVRVCKDHENDLASFPYSRMFLFLDGLKVMKEETLTSLAIAAVMVFFVTLILLGSFGTATLVFLMVAFTDLAILAAFVFMDQPIEFVSALVLVLAVGFSVDYSAHIAHAFLHSNGTSGDERARDALSSIGKSVVCGGFSTWLAVVLLPFSNSYLFERVIFWSMTFTVGFGMFHGLVVLPVLLSLVHDFRQWHSGQEGAISDPTVKATSGKAVLSPVFTQMSEV